MVNLAEKRQIKLIFIVSATPILAPCSVKLFSLSHQPNILLEWVLGMKANLLFSMVPIASCGLTLARIGGNENVTKRK